MEKINKKVNEAFYFIDDREYVVLLRDGKFIVLHSYYDRELLETGKLLRSSNSFNTLEEKENFLKWFKVAQEAIDYGEF